VVRVEQRRNWGMAALTGIGFGLAALTREVALPVAGVCAIWWMGTARPERRRLALGQGALMLGVTLLVIVPWSIRNHALFGRVIPVSTVGWFAAAEGNSLERSDWLLRDGPAKAAFHRDYFSTRDEMQRYDLARRHALERIRDEQPSWLFKKTVRNLALLLNPDSVLRLKIRRGAYGDQPEWPLRMLLMLSIPAWIALFVFGVFGVATARGEGRRSLALLVFAVVGLLHVFANATPRFRVPWLPLLGIYAANAALGWRSLPRRLSRGGAAAALAALLFFFGVCIPYLHYYGGRP
jgi:4-amino-4-deoxy-L-arabinose transferase-like glycosyltransferase